MPSTNLLQVSHSLVFRYQQNLPNLFCSCSQHNRAISLLLFFFYFRECVFFRPAKVSAKRARSARNARGGKAVHTLFTLALACKRQTYFRSSLLSLRSDDRKFVCCSQATLAFARLKNAKKKTPVAQAITPRPRLKVEFMKNKKQNKPTGKKRRSCLLKNKTCFERNEETVRLADSSVSVESMRSLLRLLILIIKI